MQNGRFVFSLIFMMLGSTILFAQGPSNCLNFDGSNDYVSFSDQYNFDFTALTLEAVVNITEFNINGQRVRILVADELKPAGISQASWDARNGTGDIAPSGVYLIML